MRMRWSSLAMSSSAPAELPLIDHPDRVLLDLLRARRRYDEHGELRALRHLEGGELLLERRPLFCGQRSGEIGDARGERWDRLQPGRRSLCQSTEGQRQQQRHRPARAAGGAMRPADHCFGGCPAGCGGGVAGAPGVEVSKVTVGAVEICCSLATVKFGFTWKPNILAVMRVGKVRTVTL